MRCFALLLLTTLCVAQDRILPTPLPADLEALSKRVEEAHQPKGKQAPVTAFDGSITLHVLDTQAAQGGPVDIRVRYFAWTRPDLKVRHLIRYELREAGAPIESGRDQKGIWHMVQGEARDVTEADTTDRAACERNTNLARQLVRFLEPGAVLRALAGPSPVREAPLQLGREAPTACEVAEGTLPSFPLLQAAGGDAPVQAKVYVAKASARLVAIEVSPLKDGIADPARTELVSLVDLHEQDGFLIPRQLLHLQRGDDGRMRLLSKTVLTALSLRPDFTTKTFDRPAK